MARNGENRPVIASLTHPTHLDEAAVSRRTGLARNTLAKMRVSGKGPRFVKVGAKVLYPVVELDSWLEALPARRSTSDRETVVA